MANCSPPQAAAFVSFRTTPRELIPGLHLLSYQSVGRGGSAGRSGNLSPRFSHVLGAELRAFPHHRTRCNTTQPSHLSRNLHFPFIPVPSPSVGGTSSLRGRSGLSARHPQGPGGCCRSIPRAASGCSPVTALPDEPYLERPIPKAGSPQVHGLPNLFFLSPFSWLTSC